MEEISGLIALTLIFIRLSTFFMIVKVFFPNGTPKQVKVFLSLVFSLILVNGIDYTGINSINSMFDYLMYIIYEISTGVILGLITNIAFDVITMAGSIMDVHIGLSMISVLDPNTKVNSSLTGNLLHYIAMTLFFIVDGHHLLIKSLIQSFILVPIGNTIAHGDKMSMLIEIVVEYFIIGLKIAIPIVLIIIITDLCMGLVSRAVPQINVMILGMPVKIVVGLITVVISLPIIMKVMVSIFSYLPGIFNKIFATVPIMFIFASEEKTEEATPKKKSDARKKGQIARSKDVGLALTMIACTLVVISFGKMIVNGLRGSLIYFLGNSNLEPLTQGTLDKITSTTIGQSLMIFLPIVLPIMIAGIVGSLAQSGFMLTGEPLKPSFGKLNPINGFKNMFSMKSLVELAKNLIVIIIIGVIGFMYLKENYPKILQIGNLYLPTLGVEVQSLISGIFVKISIVMVVLAAIDYFVQFKLHNKDMRMTKQEIKEEYKQMEGDPQIKSKIKQRQREMSQKRMMQSIADATVVITNPTHIAVAIKYNEGEMEAPILLAKGAENIAMKIKEKAIEEDVPIIENKPLARMIYEKVDIEQEIPQDMYQAVAEILVMVYKLKKK